MSRQAGVMISVTSTHPVRVRAMVVLLTCVALSSMGLSGAAESRAAVRDDAASPGGQAGDDHGKRVVTSPLTGLPVAGDGLGKPVSVVKVDNTSHSRPQVGLDRAGLVVEELVEGGLTRLAAFYHSDYPEVVGPVRSMRLTDSGIVLPAEGPLFASGAAPVVKRRLERRGVRWRTEGSAGFFREPSRKAPYDLMLNLAKAVAKFYDVEQPADYLPFSDAPLRRGTPVDRFSVSFSSVSTTRWRPYGDGWVRANAPVESADDFAADNVLVIKARTHNADYVDPGGNPVPVTEFRGTGKAMLFADGKMARARWHKDGYKAPLTLRNRHGRKLSVPAGQTFIELIPRKRGSVHLP
ncbi:DUF3048 domain-containing protein [Solicola gregarius]|uniref:DUF3048 domain-containing protein n=1 Tax=Solicola gregarius TaxID=2908642 RepID=A0AA46TLT2_9ACTN|nr:DUF3048 domain-containing protein [Solicola gregarius]UYM07641.1 DUF3048 domain-containing protein [Solicola gregarius]